MRWLCWKMLRLASSMSIQTPTSEVHSPLDVGVLAKLAGEFFAALPGERAEPQAALNVAPSATALGRCTSAL